MMRTTLATLALAAVTVQAADFYQKTDLTAITECTNVTGTDLSFQIGELDVMTIAATGEGADVAACAAKLTALTEDEVKCITDAEGEYSLNAGASAACPLENGAACTKDQFCTVGVCPEVAEGAVCPSSVAPTEGKFTKIEIKTKTDLTVAENKTALDDAIAKARTDSGVTTCNADFVVGAWVAGSKGESFVSIVSLPETCTAENKTALQKSFETVVSEAKLSASISYSDVNATDFNDCFDNSQTGNKYYACHAANANCLSIKCAVSESCTDGNQCGSGKCAVAPTPEPAPAADEVKVCVSSSVAAVVAPVVAAVLAVAFF